MPSSGPNTAGTGADDATVGTIAWTTPGNVAASNNTYTTAATTSGATSHYLKATNFGFAIPTGAVITGIKVEFEIKASTTVDVESSIKLVKGGTIQGTDKSTGAAISTTEGFMSYGGDGILWGLTFTPADINASTFGAVFSGVNNAKETNCTLSIDSCRITVYYTLGNASFLTRLTQNS